MQRFERNMLTLFIPILIPFPMQPYPKISFWILEGVINFLCIHEEGSQTREEEATQWAMVMGYSPHRSLIFLHTNASWFSAGKRLYSVTECVIPNTEVNLACYVGVSLWEELLPWFKLWLSNVQFEKGTQKSIILHILLFMCNN